MARISSESRQNVGRTSVRQRRRQKLGDIYRRASTPLGLVNRLINGNIPTPAVGLKSDLHPLQEGSL